MVDSIESLQGAGAAARADRPGDPDGVRGHGQAPVPGRLRAHRGRRGRDRRGAGGDPRHRPEGRRERRRVLRPPGGPRGDRRRCASTASTSTCWTRTGRSTSAAAGDSPLKGKSVVITGAFTDPRSGAKISRPDVTRLVEQAAATTASSVSANTDYLLAGDERRRVEDRQGRQARRRRSSEQDELWRWLAEAGVL